jgi:predicted nucleotidyltransferase
MTELVVSTRAQSNIALPQAQIADFCRRWNIAEFALFGSVMRDDFRPDSDVDVLVSFGPDSHWSLFDFVDMQLELSEIFGRHVDLVERSGLRNPFMRREILKSLEHPMRPSDPDLAHLWDIREAAGRVYRHTQGATWERFQSDEMLQDAVAHLLEIIGEAARNLSQLARDAHPEIRWIRMIGLKKRTNPSVLSHQPQANLGYRSD